MASQSSVMVADVVLLVSTLISADVVEIADTLAFTIVPAPAVVLAVKNILGTALNPVGNVIVTWVTPLGVSVTSTLPVLIRMPAKLFAKLLFIPTIKEGEFMSITQLTISLLSMTGLFSAIVGLLIRRMERRQDEKEKLRYERDLAVMNGVDAACTLGITLQEELEKDGVVSARSKSAADYCRNRKHELEDVCKRGAAQAVR